MQADPQKAGPAQSGMPRLRQCRGGIYRHFFRRLTEFSHQRSRGRLAGAGIRSKPRSVGSIVPPHEFHHRGEVLPEEEPRSASDCTLFRKTPDRSPYYEQKGDLATAAKLHPESCQSPFKPPGEPARSSPRELSEISPPLENPSTRPSPSESQSSRSRPLFSDLVNMSFSRPQGHARNFFKTKRSSHPGTTNLLVPVVHPPGSFVKTK